MLNLCKRPLETCFGVGSFGGGGSCSGGSSTGDELIWQTNLKSHAFGDYSMAVVQANSSLEDQGQVVASPTSTFAGIFDGHGGPDASRFINSNLFSTLHKYASEQGGFSADVLRKTIDTTEHEFLKLVRRSWISNPHIARSGSCCLVAVISTNNLYIANLGDSRAVLGRKVYSGRGMFSPPAVVAQRLTSDHNVGNEDVRKEVRALHPDDSHILVHTRGCWRIKGIIQVSRTIGDIYLKFPEFTNIYQQFGSSIPLQKAVITAEPTVSVRKLDSDDMFLILASDGLWEHLSDQTAANIVYKTSRVGIAKRLAKAAMQEAARKRGLIYDDLSLFENGPRRELHDDITVMVIYFDRQSLKKIRVSERTPLLSHSTTPADVVSYNSGALVYTPDNLSPLR